MHPLNTLALTVESDGRTAPLLFPVRRVINAGYVGRNRQAVEAHIEELRREGIPPPPSVPALFPVTADNVTTAERIEVLGRETSGEAEYVLFVQSPDEIYVGVGSDHTDRALERDSLGKSKQICKNVVSRQVWRYDDLQPDWDDLVLQSWVRSGGAEEVLYQQGTLGSILPPGELLDFVFSRMQDPGREGLVVYSGTIPLLGGHMIAADQFRTELRNPRTGRRLWCSYRCEILEFLKGSEDTE
ncbi:MAG: DUF2848 family protein [Planctomycetes bacterium]|nr:DUF2848 family protein [Planctomycetota bacterium]